MNTYEGMFLFDTSKAGDAPAMQTEIERLMQRAGANLVVCKKWDERRLAYEVGGRKRGCYVLTYFNAPPDKIVDLERDAQLSEMILRLLVLRAEGIAAEKMEAPSPAEAAAAEREASRRRAAEAAGRSDTKPAPAAAAHSAEPSVAVAEMPKAEPSKPQPEAKSPAPAGDQSNA